MYPYDNYSQSQSIIKNQLLESLGQTSQPAERHVIKVNGRAGADNLNLPPNSDDIALDMNDSIIYFIQTDGAGYKTVTPYDISPHKEISPEDKFKSLEDRLSKLEEVVAHGQFNSRPAGEPRKHDGSNGKNNDAGNRSLDKG